MMDLKEYAAETTTGGESVMEATEIMEESLAATIAFLPKRKAESDLENEESDDEYVESDDDNEYVDPDDELMYPTWWTVPEWDVDSFDGREYHSSQEEDEFSDEEYELKLRRFKRQLIENKGFGVDEEVKQMSGHSDHRIVRDLDMYAALGQTYREYFAEMACLCLKKYNEENSKKNGFTVEFVEVVRGIYTACSRSKSYITFRAREKPAGPLVEYQAKVWCTVVPGENYPILCRPAPSLKKASNSKELEIGMTDVEDGVSKKGHLI